MVLRCSRTEDKQTSICLKVRQPARVWLKFLRSPLSRELLKIVMVDSLNHNPYAPPPVLLDTPESSVFGSSRNWLRRLLIQQCTVVVAGLPLALWEIETIMGSGPALAIAGLLVAIVARKHHDGSLKLLGLSGPAFAFFIFALIDVMEWGPDKAATPVLLLSVCYSVLLFSLLAMLRIAGRRPTVLPGDAELR